MKTHPITLVHTTAHDVKQWYKHNEFRTIKDSDTGVLSKVPIVKREAVAIAMLLAFHGEARKQKTNRPWTNLEYMQKLIHINKRVAIDVRRDLVSMGYIDIIERKRDSKGHLGKQYILVNYMHTTKTIEKLGKISHDDLLFKLCKEILLEHGEFFEFEPKREVLIDLEIRGRMNTLTVKYFYLNENHLLCAECDIRDTGSSFDYIIPRNEAWYYLVDTALSLYDLEV